ncbi:glycosyl hydrolase [Flavobacterium sp. LM5]|uniref:WD40/YVTN/BNR-like repeat-containing protein n=1 Tax=Flavobacterium sp. LM5 TaxID=1938610 RepID=UPI000992891A|nr:glycosyl hydrolase [Flavobacterium sp. LM5]OOV26327.1 glycosyl hydrolase [Flavobacterium sp. LM5]
MTKKLFLVLLLASISSTLFAQKNISSKPADLNAQLKVSKWRSIGPFRGGRSVTATGVTSDPLTYYMGTTGGGLWKTQDMGVSWHPISDGFFKTSSVGAITVAESDPNVIYVGMGEHAVRGVMTHHGDGIYKSTDAGRTWKHLGLETTQHISRICIDPKNSDIVYVAAQGALYSKSQDRGIYKTTNGGLTWEKVLYKNDQTGAVELSMDATNSRILYAAMWEHGRKPWQVTSGGAGSGLYKSVDSGVTWTLMQEGLPKEMGKMAIAVSPTNPDKVYALIESDWEKEAGGLYISNDAGKSWSQVTTDHRLIQRSWYYIELFIDPNHEDTIYVMSAPAMRSTDGGKTWENISKTHGDYHNLWINPKNSNNMIIADDGGAAITFNKGKSWSSQDIYATGQFYRIAVDNQFPYNIYAGQQDNTSVKIASRNLSGYGISEKDWSVSAGGESAFLAFDPANPRFVFGGSYQGTIEVLDTQTKTSTNVMAAPILYLGRDAKDMKYRFNWNAPIIRSKHEPDTYFHGSQLVLRTDNMGQSWTETSPDLTRNDKSKQGKPGVPFTNEAVGAENYGTLAYIEESSLEKGVMYTGSDDGLVHLTKDGGKTWKNVTPANLTECLINAIEVSPFDKATAYIATTRYKFNDHTPGLYKTTDYGKTWKKINNGIPANAFTRVIREDDTVKNLLYAGTELGVFVSFDGGNNWQSFQVNLPLTPITDLKVHQNNLIAATSGRGFWILDDLNLIRELAKESKDSKSITETIKLFAPNPTFITTSGSELDVTDAEFTGMGVSKGVNPASGVVVYYQLPELKESEVVTLQIMDNAGTIVRTYSSKVNPELKSYDGGPSAAVLLSKNKGLNRIVWDMRHTSLLGIPNVYIEGSYDGHKVAPGTYTITLKVANQEKSAQATVLPNPLFDTKESDYTAYHTLKMDLEQRFNEMQSMINGIYIKQQQISTLIAQLMNSPQQITVLEEAQKLVQKMKTWDESMVQRKSKAYDDVENFPNKFNADYLYLINQSESTLPKITQPVRDLKLEYDNKWIKMQAEGFQILNQDIPALNKKLWEAGVGGIWIK